MSTLKQLYSQRAKLTDQISAIECAERVAENEAKVGKTFIYRNGYNSTERWDMYTLVTSIDEYGHFSVFQFETDSRGKTSVGNETRFSMSGDYQEIPRSEFDVAWQAALKAITTAYYAA